MWRPSGAGDRPCVILMVGAHVGPEARYPVSELAARYGASAAAKLVPPALGLEPFGVSLGGHSGTLAQPTAES
jgi:hypothetical protein